ncbi:MAG: hypothetical protein ACK55Z_37885, partial [bacterium]
MHACMYHVPTRPGLHEGGLSLCTPSDRRRAARVCRPETKPRPQAAGCGMAVSILLHLTRMLASRMARSKVFRSRSRFSASSCIFLAFS